MDEPPDNQTGSLAPIFTVGYGSRSFEALAALLEEHGVECLVDVRSAPYSRFRPEFSRGPLEGALNARRIRYVFQGEALGGRPDDPACYVDGRVDYERVKERESYRKGIDRLRRASEQGMRVVLMCSEGRPEECHRSKLIGASLEESGIPVLHLDENDAPQSQDEVIRRLTDGQLSLFGGPEFTSRRRYGPKEPDDDA